MRPVTPPPPFVWVKRPPGGPGLQVSAASPCLSLGSCSDFLNYLNGFGRKAILDGLIHSSGCKCGGGGVIESSPPRTNPDLLYKPVLCGKTQIGHRDQSTLYRPGSGIETRPLPRHMNHIQRRCNAFIRLQLTLNKKDLGIRPWHRSTVLLASLDCDTCDSLCNPLIVRRQSALRYAGSILALQ